MNNNLDEYIGKFVAKNCGSMKGVLGRLTKNSQGYHIIYFDGSSLNVNEKTVEIPELSLEFKNGSVIETTPSKSTLRGRNSKNYIIK